MKTKLSLDKIKITSFVTCLEANETTTIKGGLNSANPAAKQCIKVRVKVGGEEYFENGNGQIYNPGALTA